MPAKKPGGSDNGGSNGSNGSGGSAGGGSGSAGGERNPISVYSEGLRNSSRAFASLGESFNSSARYGQELGKYRPLTKDDSDESWNNFEPGYVNSATTYSNAVLMLSTAVGQLADSLVSFADLCEKVEDNNSYIGKNALNMKAKS